jgi:hypothetical protein
MATCLLTIHGVGLQDRTYADALHAHLRAALGEHISEAVTYIRGEWPPH